MSSEVYPIHVRVSPAQRIARLVRGLMWRVNSIDLRYADPWERRR